jgi:hypothetical protein
MKYPRLLHNIPAVRAILDGGVSELISYGKAEGVNVDTSDCFSACGVCQKIMEALKDKTKAV